jgi:CHAT domain-containing protein
MPDRAAASRQIVLAACVILVCQSCSPRERGTPPIGKLSETSVISAQFDRPTAPVLSQAAAWRTSAQASPTPDNLHRLGIAHLTVGNFAEAVKILEELAAANANASLFSDLAVAYLGRNTLTGDAEDLALALNSAEAAIRIDDDLAAAWFNAAMSQSRLGMVVRARRYWARYLEIETDADWRREAEVQAETLQAHVAASWSPGARVTRANAFLVRRWLVEEGFASAASTASDLARVSSAARALSQETKDPMWAAVADELSRRPAGSAEAYARMAQAMRAIRMDDFPNRQRHLEAACPLLAGFSSLFSPSCEAELGSVRYQQTDYALALRMMEAVYATAVERGYTFLAGRAQGSIGTIQTVRGDRRGAAETLSSAIALLSSAAAEPEAATLRTQLADLYSTLGRQKDAWQQRLDALRSAASVGEARTDHSVYQSASLYCLTVGLPDAARAFGEINGWELSEMMSVSRHLRLIRAAIDTGDVQGGRARLLEARAVIDRSIDPRAKNIEADVDVAEGLVLGAEDQPAAAAEALRRGIGKMGIVRERQRTDALIWLSRYELRAGTSEEAWKSLNDAASRIQRRARQSQGADLQMQERAWLWSGAAELVIADGGSDPDGQMLLLDSIKSWSMAPRLFSQQPLGPSQGLLYFVVAENAFGAWLKTAGATRFYRFADDPRRIARLLASLRAQYRSGIPIQQIQPTLRRLHDSVLGPLKRDLAGLEHLHIVPDGFLFAVPFAGLLDQRTGRYLVEDVSLSFSYQVPRVAAKTLGTPVPAGAVLVGNPTRTDLDALPQTEREVGLIAALIDGSHVLLRERATEASFRQAMTRAAIIHFAGHAVADTAAPMRSRLLLAPGSGAPADDGVLSVAELHDRMLSARLVVLAACQTATSSGDKRFGVSHLANEILRAGARSVVAATDEIPDDAAELFVALHRGVSAGVDPVRALQQAQREMLTDRGRPRPFDQWALVVHYGPPFSTGAVDD